MVNLGKVQIRLSFFMFVYIRLVLVKSSKVWLGQVSLG